VLRTGAADGQSVLRRQENEVVGEVELEPVKRKIREWDDLGVEDITAAVTACEARRPVGFHRPCPDLKSFACDRLLEDLRDRDGAEQPAGSEDIPRIDGA